MATAQNSGTSPVDLIWTHFRFDVAQAIYVAVALGIPDVLAEEPLAAAVIAARTRTHEPSLRRLLRALASEKILVEESDGQYRLPDSMRRLTRRDPRSVRTWILYQGGPLYRAFGDLLHVVQTGEDAYHHLYGQDFYAYQTDQPEGALLYEMMSSVDESIQPILRTYDFGQHRTIVDVGGGRGRFLSELLKAYPLVSGTLFDLPAVARLAIPELLAPPLSERCQVMAGNFTQSVPEGSDCYVLMSILVDWSDEHARGILRNCRTAVSHSGRVVVVEPAMPEQVREAYAYMWDLKVMLTKEGRLRTVTEMSSLMGGARLSVESVRPLPSTTGETYYNVFVGAPE